MFLQLVFIFVIQDSPVSVLSQFTAEVGSAGFFSSSSSSSEKSSFKISRVCLFSTDSFRLQTKKWIKYRLIKGVWVLERR